MKNNNYKKLSIACKKATGYRTVMNFIVKFAERELKQLHPEKSRQERIILAQDEPFWTAAKECRELTKEEKNKIGLPLK